MNKKILMFMLVGIFGVMIVTAGLVDYLSNTVNGEVTVNSPITITVDGEESYNLELYASESKSITSLTEIHVDGVTGHIAEIKIPNFDGEGITVDYRVDAYPGIFQIPVCINGTDAYYYIGDPTETLNKSSFNSTTTFNTVLNLDPTITYNIESKVIMAVNAGCNPIPHPIYTPDQSPA